MNISRLLPGSLAGANATGPDAADAEARVSPTPPAAPASADRSDRFELSDAARAHQAEVAARQAEVEAARTALRADDALSPERLAQLQQRVENGFYDNPEAIEVVADRAAADLRASES